MREGDNSFFKMQESPAKCEIFDRSVCTKSKTNFIVNFQNAIENYFLNLILDIAALANIQKIQV